MKLLLIVILTAISGCQNLNTNSGNDQKSAVVNHTGNNPALTKQMIPQRVADYLKSTLPDMIIPDISDYSSIWWCFYDKSQIPYFVTVDLNDDRLSDYAFILKKSNSLRLVILLDRGKTFTHWISDDFKETFKKNDIHFGINIEPPGRIDCIASDKSLVLKSNGITLMNYEFKTRIYYWFQEKFRMFNVKEMPL